MRHRLDRDDFLESRVVTRRLVGVDHAGIVDRAAEATEAEARDVRAVRDDDVLTDRGCHQRSSPYLSCIWRATALWIDFQRRASSARARGSTLRSAKASSRSSLRWLSRRSSVRVPSASAARTAHPGSPLWPQFAEAAGTRELVDVVERGLDALVGAGYLERPDPWGVDEQGTAREPEQLAVGRRVAPARVVFADIGGGLSLLAEQGIHERGLPHTGRAEDDRRAPRTHVRGEIAHVVTGQRREDHDGDARGHGLDRHQATLEVARHVGLVEDHDRGHATGPRDGQVAFQAAQVEVAVQPRDEERHVDIRGDDLLVGQVAGGPAARIGRAPDEGGAPGENGGDRGRIVGSGLGAGGFEGHPVPDGRIVRRGKGFVAEATGHGGRPIRPGPVADDRRLLVHGHDPGGRPPGLGERCVGGIPPGVPAEAREVGGPRQRKVVGRGQGIVTDGRHRPTRHA